jgi:hypothetical protein
MLRVYFRPYTLGLGEVLSGVYSTSGSNKGGTVKGERAPRPINPFPPLENANKTSAGLGGGKDHP